MENRQDGFEYEQEIVEEECQEQSQMEGDEEHSEEVLDELLPQPAFQIEEDHDNLTEEEREAFSYIFSVRNQKEAILRHKQRSPETEGSSMVFEQLPISIGEKEKQLEQIWQALQAWKEESVGNWRLVIQNLKYLQKTATKEQYIKQKLTIDMMAVCPQAYKLCLNKSLNLFYIERYLVDFSNAYYEILSNKLEGSNENGAPNFYMWIYSLLALQQSYASYTNFEALASINAVMDKEADYLQKNLQKVSSNQIISWLLNLILLIDVFKQTFLKKHLRIVRAYGLI